MRVEPEEACVLHTVRAYSTAAANKGANMFLSCSFCALLFP